AQREGDIGGVLGIVEGYRDTVGCVIGHLDVVRAIRAAAKVGEAQNRLARGGYREGGGVVGVAGVVGAVQPRAKRVRETIGNATDERDSVSVIRQDGSGEEGIESSFARLESNAGVR